LSTRGNQKKIVTALTVEDARRIFSQDEEYLVVDDAVKNVAIEIAMSAEKGGIDEAHRFIGNTLVQDRAEASAAARRQAVAPIVNANAQTFAGLADSIFRAASQGYISLSPNVTVGAGPFRRDVILQALDDWRVFEGDGLLDAHITNVHVFPPENKAGQGKGNVGDTLATRKWQANVISKWFGRVINVHIDLDNRDIPT